jgi:tripartite-type tricarboxylate transporter receptor subunit TctC
VKKLHDAAVKSLEKPEVKQKYAGIGIDPAPMNPSELARFIQSEIALWAKLVKLAGIQPE